MVVSLYICEIPKNVTKQDIENIFCEFDGYKETRMKGNDIDKRKIAFVDYETESNARFALETLNGFKFSVNDKGIFIKFSDNNKNGENQSGKPKQNRYLNKKRNNSKSPESDREKYRKKRFDDNYNNSIGKKEDFDRRSNNYQNNNFSNTKSSNKTYNQSTPQNTFNSNLPNSNETSNNNLNVLSDFVNILQNAQALNLFGNLGNLPGGNNNNPPNDNMNQSLNLNNFGNLLGTLASTMANTSQQPCNSNINNNNNTNMLQKYDNELKKIMDFPKNATNIVYVEGFPYETSEREISHIFRPFSGFLSVRLITREKNGEKTLICFADFENVFQSTICIYTLQGYRFDKNDLVGLHFSYGVNKQKK